MHEILMLVICTGPLALRALLGPRDHRSYARFGSYGLAAAFVFFAMARVVMPHDLVSMLPAWVPQRLAIVYASGALELCIAMALITSRWRKFAGIVAASVLVLFFPVNVYAAFHRIGELESVMGPAYLLLRGPIQLILAAWTYWPISWAHQPSAD